MTATLRLNISKAIAVLIFIVSAAFLIHPVFAIDLPAGRQVATSSTTRREKVQERIDTRKEKMASREAILKAKLDAFRDKKKAQTADRINTNLNKANQNQTMVMQKHLDALTALLNKVEKRVNKTTPEIADARAKISSASSAVQAQSEKDYTITVTTESKVRTDAQAKREELYKDIMALRKQIIDAKQSISNVIRIAKGGTVVKEGTSSGQQ